MSEKTEHQDVKKPLDDNREKSNRPEGKYCEPTVLFDQKTSEKIDWKAYYGF